MQCSHDSLIGFSMMSFVFIQICVNTYVTEIRPDGINLLEK